MASTNQYQYEQPKVPDGWSESERRFYNRVVEIFDDIYAKYRNESMTRIVKTVIDESIRKTISATEIAAYSFSATFANMVQLSAKLANFDFETVQNLISSALVVDEIMAGKVSIANLIVKYGQFSEAVFDSICVKCSDDGKYYNLSFSADGTVTATEKTDITPEEIAAGFTNNAQRILAMEITAAELNTRDLKATYALVDSITAARIDVLQLFAIEAFVEKLATTHIVGDKSITLIAQETVTAQSTAEAAGTAASNAQSAAGNAQYAADAAQSTADAAGTAAIAAQTTADSAQETADNAAETANNAATAASAITQRVNPILQAVQVQSDGLYIRAVSLDPVTGEYVIVPDAYYNRIINTGYELKSPTALYPDFKIRPRKQISQGRVYFRTSDGGMAQRAVMPSDYDD